MRPTSRFRYTMASLRLRASPRAILTSMKPKPPRSGGPGSSGRQTTSRSACQPFDERPDPDIARDAVAAIKSQLPISSERIKVVIKNGWVSLEGQVEWQYQRQTAEKAVRRVKGGKGGRKLIAIKT